MIIAGIDFSITCPAICTYDTAKGFFHFSTCNFFFNQQNVTLKEQVRRNEQNISNIFSSPRYLTASDEMRYYYLIDWALSILLESHVETVILEDYALGAKGKVFNIAEATGLLKHYLFLNNISIKKITPCQNKKLFSAKGNANKELMIQSFKQKTGINITTVYSMKDGYTGSPISDLVDSYSLLDSYLSLYSKNTT